MTKLIGEASKIPGLTAKGEKQRARLERKTELRAKKRLERKSSMKAKPARPGRGESKLPPAPKRSPRGPVEDPAYLRRVAKLPCMHCGAEDGTIVPHHYEEHSGMALKCSDYETVPLCLSCHLVWWHGKLHLEGISKEESLEKMRAFGAHLRERFLDGRKF